MHISLLVLAFLFSSFITTLSSVIPSTSQLLDRGVELESQANSALEERYEKGQCTPEKVYIRKEWLFSTLAKAGLYLKLTQFKANSFKAPEEAIH